MYSDTWFSFTMVIPLCPYHSDEGIEDWSMDSLGKEHRRIRSTILQPKTDLGVKLDLNLDINRNRVG